jgi:NAD(P)-dependent dehydrogenase (short-subunit alcohol dehydrogenase family)
MARIFITGSADGLGQLAANALVAQGHKVVLHARNATRGRETLAKVPDAKAEHNIALATWRDDEQPFGSKSLIITYPVRILMSI